MSENQSIIIDKDIYIKLKKLANKNECTINEEIGTAFTERYDDIDESLLEEIDIIPRKDKIFLVLPEDLYSLFEEESISEELNSLLDEHISASDEEESEDEYEEESEEEESEEEESEEESEEEYEDEEESEEEEEPKAKKKPKQEKGFFDTITEAVGEFVDDLINDEDETSHKKKKR